jgi:protocatechuate 3,4-dioxygenase beta subunit
MRYQYVQGSRRLMPSGRGGATNDIGEYRIFGLTPGQYYVSATLRSGGAINTDTSDRSGYAPTFFPGTGNQAEAQRMGVAPGQTITGINLTLLPIQTATVSGTVLDVDGRPLAAGMIRVGPKTPMGGAGFVGASLREGRFTLNGLTPGDYVIQVSRPGGSESATAEVAVSGSDISGLQIQIAPPSTIRGRIVFTPSANGSDPPKPTAYDLGAVREWALGQPVRSPAKIKDDGTFEISLQAGHVQLRATPVGGGAGPNGPPPWRINRVLFTGIDVGDAGIDVAANAAVEDVVVEVTNKSSEATGTVTDAEGKTVRDVFVIVFAQDPERWTVQTRWLAVSRPGLDDRFHARLLAGDYYAVAISDVETNAWTDADFLSLAREHATKFSVGDNETKTLDLTVSPAPVY